MHDHHNENMSSGNLSNAFKTGIIINIIFVVVEAFYGYVSNSMALVADAGHNLSDVMALVFSWIAIILSRRKPTSKYTYGFRRSTILIALLNTVLLLAAVAIIAWEAIGRIGKPVEIKSVSVILIALAGIVVNGFTAWLFHKDKKHDLNVKSAFVHFVADALVSIGVVVAGALIYLTGLVWIDIVVSFIIIAVILYSTYHLLIDSINLALDAVPEDIDISMVGDYLDSIEEVESYHDLHIWALGTADSAMTVHLVTKSPTDMNFISRIQTDIKEKFGIDHTTIQVEYGKGENECATNCK
jgi:cobalt-zinc-cadmium efflux system protein